MLLGAKLLFLSTLQFLVVEFGSMLNSEWYEQSEIYLHYDVGQKV